MEWSLKDEPLMSKEEMEHFSEIAKSTGAKYVHWSGLTRKQELEDEDRIKSKFPKSPTC